MGREPWFAARRFRRPVRVPRGSHQELDVGVGTRLGKGCTSGHGVCGVGSASSASVVNVATFLAIAIGTALAVQSLGVSP